MSGDMSGSGSPEGVSQPSSRRSRPRRERSVTESLLSIVLVLEAFLLFFATLTAFGLRVLEPELPAWAALPIGGAFIAVVIIASGLMRFSWGVWVGWVLQVAIIATGVVMPMMFLVGAGFAALWIFCFVKARQIEALKRRNSAGQRPAGPTPEGAPS